MQHGVCPCGWVSIAFALPPAAVTNPGNLFLAFLRDLLQYATGSWLVWPWCIMPCGMEVSWIKIGNHI